MQREITLFNDGFRVAEGNFVGLNGGNFKAVKIPHDYDCLQDKSNSYPGWASQGFVDCFYVVTYKKNFSYKKEEQGEHIWLLFDGVFRNSEVYINGKLAGVRPYGYVAFYYDITTFLIEGENLLEVFVDNSTPPADRWYSGMGIYRDVHLIKTSDVHIKQWGTTITTPAITKDLAKVDIRYELLKHSGACTAQIKTEILYDNKVVATSTISGKNDILKDTLEIKNPSLWDLNTPYLYKALSSVYVDGQLKDTYDTTFGIRDFTYDSDKGMFLNGNPLKLKGVDLHHDWGCMGSAFLRDAWKKRISTLKSVGVNAIRTSHNPQAQHFYELCNEIGMLVFDEAFDKWHWVNGYYKDHFDKWWKADITSMLERDRNHPCVFIWSVGNEVEMQGTDEMIETLGMLADFVKAFEPTRPVTVAMEPHCGRKDNLKGIDHMVEMTYKMSRKVDILSCNYQEQWYEAYRKAIPDRLIIGSEVYQYYTATPNTVLFDNLVEKHPYAYVKENDYVIGSFYWAGVDYLGESYGYPARGWTSNIIDIAGFEKPFANHSRALFSDGKPFVAFVAFDEKQKYEYMPPAWSYPKCVDHMMIERQGGEVVRAATYTTCESVELIVGERSYGDRFTKEFKDNMIRWDLQYDTRDINIIGKNAGKEVCRQVIKPFGEPADIDVSADKTELTQSVHDLCFIEVKILDKDGNWNKNATTELKFKVSGNIELVGVDNGDMLSHHPYKTNILNAYKGKCMLVVRAEGIGKGTVKVMAQGIYAEKIIELNTCKKN